MVCKAETGGEIESRSFGSNKSDLICMHVRHVVNVLSLHHTGPRGRADSARLPDKGSKPRLADEDRRCRVPVRSAQAHAFL